MGTTHQRDGHKCAVRKSGTPGHPARGRYLSRQVSWLAGHRWRSSSRGVFLSDMLNDSSPLTVAGAAPVWMRKASSPNSLLAPDLTIRRTTIRLTMAAKVAMVNHIKRSLCGASFTRSHCAEPDSLLSANNVRRLDGRDDGAELPRALANLTSGSALPSGNNCRSRAMLTSAQSQGTKMASTVARGRKTEGNQGRFH